MRNYDDDLDAMKAQTEGNGKNPKKEDQKFTQSELLQKYFTPLVPSGQKTSQSTFRLIPNKESGTPFHEVRFHRMKIGPDWHKLLCLKETDEECPLCDTAQGFYAQSDKESGNKYRASTFYVVRGIDRAKELEGVKFWRFPKNFKGTGVKDKIDAKRNIYGNITHPFTGFDLIITAGLDDRSNSIVTDISCVRESKLADTDEKIEALINDDTTWKDIYKPKTAKYFEEIVAGTAQYWDKSLKKYVKPGESNTDSEGEGAEEQEVTTTTNSQVVNKAEAALKKETKNPLLKGANAEDDTIQDDTFDEDDLPF